MVRRLKALYHALIAVFALLWFRFPSRKLTVIAVTGTDGKTTTTSLIYEILKDAGYQVSKITSVHAVIGGKEYDTGFHVTTPDAFWVQKYLREAVDHGDTHMVLEVTSHALTQYRVLGITFAVGVLTNVTHEHLDWHNTFDEYLRAKLSLLTQSSVAVVNRDDAQVYTRVIDSHPKVVSFSVKHNDATVTPRNHPFSTKLPGEFNRYNCLAALAAAHALGVDKKTASRTVASFRGVTGRMETVAVRPVTVIVDFAHTPNAIEQALSTAKHMTKGKIIHVFGSAGLRDHSKRPLMGGASGRYADSIILTEEDYRTEDLHTIMDEIAAGIPRSKTVYRETDREKAIAKAIALARRGDLIIITGKGHEKSLCRGTTEYPWSDVGVVRRLIARQ